MRADFRRLGATDPQASVTFNFSYATAVPMRFTRRIAVGTLGLPAGSPTIEVRLVRLTPYFPDKSNKNYVQETRWARLAAVVQLVGQTYPTATIMAFTMSNTRSSGAVNNMSLNVIATRVLPTWTGSAWSAPAATRKWADNFVARCKSPDGANRIDAQLDIPGIYALQAQLDASDAGEQGVISLTLDQMQDIDSELAQIADVARAVVYRVGRKLFVQRDQANANAIALFNARAKSPDGETVSVRMTGDADNDAVIVQWMDEALGWKRRDFQFPEDVIAVNPLRVATSLANWTQAYRRAVFEWNRLKFRREDIACRVTEDGRICRPGDVINVTDDVANLALTAGEVIAQQAPRLTLDRDVTLEVGASYSIMLRDTAGILIDRIPVTAVLGGPIPNDILVTTNVVFLQRAAVRIKGRDASLGTLYAFYRDDVAAVRPWLVVGVSKSGPYIQLSGVNYTAKVYTGDSAPLPPRPPTGDGTLIPPPTPTPPPETITLSALSVRNADSGTVSAIYRLTSTGNIEANDGSSAVIDQGDWIDPQQNFAAYSVRATPTAGTAPGGSALNVWLPLNATREWSITSGGFDYSGILVEIQFNETAIVIASANIGFSLHS